MTLDALEALVTDPATPLDECDAAVAEVWRCCLQDDQELWVVMLAEAETGMNEETLAEQMQRTLLFTAAHKRRAQIKASIKPKTKASTRHGVYASPALLEALVRDEHDAESIVSVRALPLFVKTLHLAVDA
jgi:nucleotide-binding universal stress UspA family protein